MSRQENVDYSEEGGYFEGPVGRESGQPTGLGSIPGIAGKSSGAGDFGTHGTHEDPHVGVPSPQLETGESAGAGGGDTSAAQ